MFTFLLSNAWLSIWRQRATTFVPEMKDFTPAYHEIQSQETLRVCTLVYTSLKFGLTGTRPFIHPAVCAQYAISGFLVKIRYAKDSLEYIFFRICKNQSVETVYCYELSGHSSKK